MGDRVSVVPQWLGICLPVQATRFRTGKIPRAVRQLSPCATASEARTNKRPCSAANKAVAVRSPGITTRELPPLVATKKKKKEKKWGIQKGLCAQEPCRALLSVSFTFSFKYLKSQEDGDTPKYGQCQTNFFR